MKINRDGWFYKIMRFAKVDEYCVENSCDLLWAVVFGVIGQLIKLAVVTAVSLAIITMLSIYVYLTAAGVFYWAGGTEFSLLTEGQQFGIGVLLITLAVFGVILLIAAIFTAADNIDLRDLAESKMGRTKAWAEISMLWKELTGKLCRPVKFYYKDEEVKNHD